MAKTFSRQTVNGETYMVCDIQARDGIAGASGAANGSITKLLKDSEIKSASGLSAGLIDPIGNNPLTSLGIGVAGSQSGSGTPSPSNVRDFASIPSSITVKRTDRNDNEESATITFPDDVKSAVYEGIAYPTAGIIKIVQKRIVLDGEKYGASYVNNDRNLVSVPINEKYGRTEGENIKCNKLEPVSNSATWDNYTQFISYSTPSYDLVIRPPVTVSSIEEANAWLASNKPEVVIPLSVPEYLTIPAANIQTGYEYNLIEAVNGAISELPNTSGTVQNLKASNAFDLLLDKELSAVKIGESTTVSNVEITRNEDDSYTFDGTASAAINLNLTRKKISANQKIYFDFEYEPKNVSVGVFINDKSNNTLYYYTFNGSQFVQIPDDSAAENMLIRLEIGNGTTVNETVKAHAYLTRTADTKDLKILVFGNSFAYSTLAYVPSLINELYPNINLTFGILYSSGMQFTGHIANFNNNTKYSIYSKFTSGEWVDQNNAVTGKNALDEERWDFIILQQSVEHLDDFANMEVFADLVSGYLSYPVEYLYNIAQARGASDDTWLPDHYSDATMAEKSNHHFQDIADYAERALQGPIISHVIPSGTAVQNARTTSLNQYGAHGSMCYDAASHLQHGIGVLVAGYAAAYAILEAFGAAPKLYGTQLAPTDTWKSVHNVPYSGHGSCVGITDSNRLLGMKCAMMAIKKPFELTDCSDI